MEFCNMMKLNRIFLIGAFIYGYSFSSVIFAQQFHVLVYTSPDKWHQGTLPIAIDEFQNLSKQHHFKLTWGQSNGSGGTSDVFSEKFLNTVDVVVFLHSRGYDLSDQQDENFKKFIRNGGGFVGIHATSANKDQELWYQQLVGRVFTDHPEEQTAVMHVLDNSHPSTMHLNSKWIWTDEWYSYAEPLTEGQTVLLTVDENTYDPDRTWGDNNRFTAMGEFHPIAWYQEFDGGRSFYTTLGHLPQSYRDPQFLAHIYGGIYWAATGLGINK